MYLANLPGPDREHSRLWMMQLTVLSGGRSVATALSSDKYMQKNSFHMVVCAPSEIGSAHGTGPSGYRSTRFHVKQVVCCSLTFILLCFRKTALE